MLSLNQLVVCSTVFSPPYPYFLVKGRLLKRSSACNSFTMHCYNFIDGKAFALCTTPKMGIKKP